MGQAIADPHAGGTHALNGPGHIQFGAVALRAQQQSQRPRQVQSATPGDMAGIAFVDGDGRYALR